MSAHPAPAEAFPGPAPAGRAGGGTDEARGVPRFLEDPGLRLLLFGGKGGVGKTSCAVATALHIARVRPQASLLLVSTDPAHSLSDSLAGCACPGNLRVLEFDAQEHLESFKASNTERLREIASRGTFLDDEDISRFLDLSLPGLDELMAFLEIAGWAEKKIYDCIVVDTAPTGHTLRLLGMPELIRRWLGALDTLLAKHRYMKKLFSGAYQLDDLDRFLLDLAGSVDRMEALLRNRAQCCFVPVVVPEELSIRETEGLVSELERLKVPVTDLVVNRVCRAGACRVCAGRAALQRRNLAHLFQGLGRYRFWGVPRYLSEVNGEEGLRAFWSQAAPLLSPGPSCGPLEVPDVAAGVWAAPDLPAGKTSLLLFAGKGGVGKTTLACATARRLAGDGAGREVFLFSTDPAHSLSDGLDVPVGSTPTRICPGLTAMEIDAVAEFESLKDQYREELQGFLRSVMGNMDLAFDREVMERILDLSPTGIDEVMALTRVMEFLEQGGYDVFILDSAPTGHLIRLLEMPELIDRWLKVFFGLFLKYKRIFRLPKISARLVRMSKDLKRMQELLHDPGRSSLYAVGLLTEMAFQETVDLVETCRRMHVDLPVLFLNRATPETPCPVCAALRQEESRVLELFRKAFPGIHQTVVQDQGEPRGLVRLARLGASLYRSGMEAAAPDGP